MPNQPSATFLERIHYTLISNPGFYGMALSVDEAEQFPGWIDLTQPIQWDFGSLYPGGSDITVTLPDLIGLSRSTGATIGQNFVPFAIRSGLVLLGGLLLMALLLKAVGPTLQDVAPQLMEAM